MTGTTATLRARLLALGLPDAALALDTGDLAGVERTLAAQQAVTVQATATARHVGLEIRAAQDDLRRMLEG